MNSKINSHEDNIIPCIFNHCIWILMAPTDLKSEQIAITQLLQSESEFAAKSDSAKWASYWLNSDDVSFTYTNADGVQFFSGF